MKLFGSFKLTDRIRIGASSGGRKKKSSSVGIGCFSIFLLLCVIIAPISMIRSCIKGEDEETTTETTTVVSESGIEEISFIFDDGFELEVGESESTMISVESDDEFDADDFVLISSDENIVTIAVARTARTYFYIDIEAVAPGTATISIETVDGKVKSEEVEVVVKEVETTTEKETTTKKETITKEKTTASPVVAQTEATTKKPTTTAKPVVEKKEYVLNTNTMKIHNPSCSSVEDILPHNYATTKDFDGAIADGYSPCGRCHPTGD